MKYVIFVLMIFSVFCFSGCGKGNKIKANFTGYSKVCVDGVEYLQFPSGATVSYNKNGTIKQCE